MSLENDDFIQATFTQRVQNNVSFWDIENKNDAWVACKDSKSPQIGEEKCIQQVFEMRLNSSYKKLNKWSFLSSGDCGSYEVK